MTSKVNGLIKSSSFGSGNRDNALILASDHNYSWSSSVLFPFFPSLSTALLTHQDKVERFVGSDSESLLQSHFSIQKTFSGQTTQKDTLPQITPTSHQVRKMCYSNNM